MGGNGERATSSGQPEKHSQRAIVEDALTGQREFSSCLLESMAAGVVACDADGILTLFNRTAREWHGVDLTRIPPEEWARYYDLYRADGLTPLPTEEIPLARAFKGEVVTDAGMAIVAKGRPPRFILANGSVIRDEGGNKLGAVVVMRDVTELRRIEEELRKANEELEKRVVERTAELKNANDQLQAELAERLRVENALRLTQFTMDSAADAIFWLRQDGSYFYANKAASGLLGHEVPTLLNMKAADINPAHGGAAWQSHWAELKAQGVLRFEAELHRKDGSKVLAEITANYIEFGGQEYNCAFVRDITDRRRAEKDIRRAHDRLQSVMDSLDALVYVADMTTYRLLFMNKSGRDIWGDAVGGICWQTLQTGQSGPCPFCTNARLLLPNGEPAPPVVWEFQNTRTRRWYECRDQAIRWIEGRLVRMEVATDITERKNAESELSQETAVNAALNDLTKKILLAESVEEMAGETLKKAQGVTDSTFGYVGYIDQNTGYLVCPTMTEGIWDKCGVSGKRTVFEKFGGLWGWVLENKKSLLTNDPTGDSRSGGTPPGHIPVKRFLSAPAFHGDVLVGQIALANAARPYTDSDRAIVERIAAIFALGVRRKIAEEGLHKLTESLEQRVKERTAELEEKNAELERMNKLFVGRELRMAELKEKIRELEKRPGH